jgi:hypothetical protein
MMNHLKVHFKVYILRTNINKNKHDNNKNIYLECATFLKTKNILLQSFMHISWMAKSFLKSVLVPTNAIFCSKYKNLSKLYSK